MEYVVLDLEFNGVYANRLKGYLNEIINIGAVKVDQNMKIIDELSVLVKPIVSKDINKHVEALTKLTLEELQSNGIEFKKAIKLFKDFLSDATLVTWSTSDVKAIFDNCKYFSGSKDVTFIKSFLDLQKYSEKVLHIDDHDGSTQLSLSGALKLLDIPIDEDGLHHALYDSILAYKCFARLYDAPLVESSIVKCVYPDFYDKVTFKNRSISDPKKAHVDISTIDFYCETCRKKATRISNWERKNKSLQAIFRCDECHKEFKGRLKFIRTYDGIKVNRSQLDIN